MNQLDYFGELGKELQWFGHRLGLAIDPILIDYYRIAHRKIFPQAFSDRLAGQFRMVARAVDDQLDVEAIEFVWRLKDRHNVLTLKLHVFMYLLETNPANYAQFINHDKRFFTAFAVLGWHGIRAVIKTIKGFFILRRLQAIEALNHV